MPKKNGIKIDILEKNFQRDLIKELKQRFTGCIVCKLDARYIQGIPDLLILQDDHWAALEVKKSNHASRRPNQKHYVDRMNKMSFARFISPENKESVLNEMESAFKSRRNTRVS